MKHFYLILGLFSALLITSCNKDPEVILPPTFPTDNTNNVIIKTNITKNTTWVRDSIYQLSGRITVTNEAILTIEPGTIIKGEPGIGANASSLIIARGAKLIAEGTEESPIIFTSEADNITIEDVKIGIFTGSNFSPNINGLWGGVIILGRSPISASETEVQIEGIPTSDPNGLYGGNDPLDNSGILRYVSIRHGGANIGSGNEINGLTLGGVGSSTIIDNIEVIANQDDGIELFGGTVNVTNVVVWNVGDDAIDTDQAWSGTLDNFVIISPQGHCFELDGPEGFPTKGQSYIRNGEVIASNVDWDSMDLINTDDNTVIGLENIFITGIKPNQMINRVNYELGMVTFNNVVLDVVSLRNHIGGDPQTIPVGIKRVGTSLVNKSYLEWVSSPI
jgi:hypothetical protein